MTCVLRKVWHLRARGFLGYPKRTLLQDMYNSTARVCARQREGIADTFHAIADDLGTTIQPWLDMEGF